MTPSTQTYCNHDETFKQVKVKTCSGHWQVRKYCLECESLYDNALSQEDIDVEHLSEIVVMKPIVKCSVKGCEATETALHATRLVSNV